MTATILIIFLLSVSSPAARANVSDRKQIGKGSFLKIDTSELRGDLQEAMSEALSVDHEVDFVQRDRIDEWLRSTYKALPKNSRGLVELKVMEHAIHRYFMQHYSLSLKAFEPHRPLNASELRSTEVLGDRAPAFVEEILKGRFYHDGFTLKDATSMIATLEQFLYDDSVRRLRKAYEAGGMSEEDVLDKGPAREKIVEFIKLIDGEGEQSIVSNRSPMAWRHLQDIEGELDRIVYKRQKTGRGKSLLLEGFTFKEVAHAAHAVVLSGSALFSDCDGLRKHLASFDSKNAGRAKLSDLYWSDAEVSGYVFGESKDWLRRMGVLDESSAWMGPQVIIPNYMQAASNCIMTTSLFRQCCPNQKCQKVLSHLEATLAKPSDKPSEIWPAIVEATKHDLEYESAIDNVAALAQKLSQISEYHGGDIPIHGRLFAQWMHYLHPQECPYPYKRGQIEVVNLQECGKGCVVDGKAQAEVEEAISVAGVAGQDEWLGQWTLDEELITAQEPVHSWLSDVVRRATSMSKAILLAAVFFALSGVVIAKVAPSLLSTPKNAAEWAPQASWNQKSHFV